jgi:hypothetical protein
LPRHQRRRQLIENLFAVADIDDTKGHSVADRRRFGEDDLSIRDALEIVEYPTQSDGGIEVPKVRVGVPSTEFEGRTVFVIEPNPQIPPAIPVGDGIVATSLQLPSLRCSIRRFARGLMG